MIALLDSMEIGYDEDGSGIPVLFIHGFPHDRSLWAPQLQGLTAQA
jgi:pimeloyl-ACP methyl ester carboxylesterase